MVSLDVFDHTASVIVTAFVNGLWQGLVLLGLIGCLLRLLDARRRLNATTRYAVWSITLMALALLPVGAGLIAAMQPASPEPSIHPEAVLVLPPVEEPLAVVSEGPALSVMAEPAIVALDEPLEGTAEPVSGPSRWHLVLPSSIGGGMLFLFGAWVLVALILLGRVARGFVYLRRLKRQSTLLPPAYQQRLDAWRRAYGLRRNVRIAASETLAAPVAAGLRDPMILVPLALLDQLTEEEFDQVALHEWAHLQRWDDWTNLIQRFVEAVLFFHPAVLWVGRQMDREREMACDDWVVWRTHQPRSYATCLTRLVELNVQARMVRVAPGMAVNKAHLFERVRRLLDQGRHVTARLSKAGLLTIALVLAAAVLLMARLAPIFTTPASSEEVAEPESGLHVEPEALVVLEPTPNSLSELQILGPGFVQVAGERLFTGRDSITVFDLPPFKSRLDPFRFDTVRFQQLQLDTILVYQTLTQQRQRLMQQASTLNQTFQTLQVATVHFQQSAATLQRVQPTLRRVSTQDRDLSVASWIRLLTSAARITSSGDKARLLIEAAQRLPQNEEVYAAYLKTAQTVGALSDRTRVLMALLTHQRLGKTALLSFLDAVKGVASDGNKTRLLIRAAAALPNDDDARAAYVEVAETIASPGSYRRAMKALK